MSSRLRVSGYATHRSAPAYEDDKTMNWRTVCGRDARYRIILAATWSGTTCKSRLRLRGDWDARQ